MTSYIIIVLLLALIGAGGYAVFRVKRAAREFSMAAFGVTSLRQGLEQQADLLEKTPKSVAGMTKVYLPQIEADFPEFNWQEFRQKADNMLKSMLASLDAQDLSYVSEASEDLKAQIRLELEEQKRRQVREHITSVKIHQTEIAKYIKRDGQCVVELQSAVEYYRYVEDTASGELKSGSKDRMKQTKYETELVYIQNPEKMETQGTAMAVTCPQCGAPVTKLGSKFCEYCGAAISVVNIHVWSIHKIKEIIL